MAKGLLVRFYTDAVHITHKSEQLGRPFYEDREFVSIIPIGDNKTEITREATADDKQRFAEEYSVFKRGVAQTFSGTPLNAWPPMTPAMIKMLNHHNVHTVEHLAGLDDIAISRLGLGMREWVTKAKAFLAQAEGTASAQHFAAENDRMKEDMARMQATIDELSARLGSPDDPPRRGPGRPPKQQEAA